MNQVYKDPVSKITFTGAPTSTYLIGRTYNSTYTRSGVKTSVVSISSKLRYSLLEGGGVYKAQEAQKVTRATGPPKATKAIDCSSTMALSVKCWPHTHQHEYEAEQCSSVTLNYESTHRQTSGAHWLIRSSITEFQGQLETQA